MSKKNLYDEKVKELLAEFCHDQWSHWMKYLWSLCYYKDNNLIIPEKFVDRWYRQMTTDYIHLSEEEKNSDRNEAEKLIELLKKIL